jgi:hypothetical protein
MIDCPRSWLDLIGFGAKWVGIQLPKGSGYTVAKDDKMSPQQAWEYMKSKVN